MATITSITKTSARGWRFQWAGTAPFRLYLNGEYLTGQTTTDTSYEVDNLSPLDITTMDPNEPPPLEVLDATETADAANVTYTPIATLQWRGSTLAAYYMVQESVDGVWVDRNYQTESNKGYYQYDTPALDDGQSNNWQVLAFDAYDVEGGALPFQFLIVRNPAPPRVTMQYNEATGNLDIFEAS